jgi:hypothetical protein
MSCVVKDAVDSMAFTPTKLIESISEAAKHMGFGVPARLRYLHHIYLGCHICEFAKAKKIAGVWYKGNGCCFICI